MCLEEGAAAEGAERGGTRHFSAVEQIVLWTSEGHGGGI